MTRSDGIMIEPESHEHLRREIGERIAADRALLDALRAEIRPLRAQVKRIQPRTATSAGVRFGTPIAVGNKVAVEWWTTMRADGTEVTCPGCLVLRFAPDGRCEELREYWHAEDGHREPPGG